MKTSKTSISKSIVFFPMGKGFLKSKDRLWKQLSQIL